LLHRVCGLYPDNFIGVCQLPQSPGVPPDNCIDELERCVNELGFVGCNLNPDPSGGHWTAPPLTDRYWYPLYEKMVELDVPAMVHVSSSCNPNFTTPVRTDSTPTRRRSCRSSRPIRSIDPETGHYFDDTKRYIDEARSVNDEDKEKIFEGNARRVYPRINARLKGSRYGDARAHRTMNVARGFQPSES